MSADVDICVRRYVQEDGAAVRTFIRDHVRADHSITQDWLFDWFYRGVGNENGAITSVVLEWNGEVAGFRGMIPGLFQVPGEDGKVSIVQGGTYAFWNIRFRGQTASFGPDICSVPIWFQPLSYEGTPINAFFRLSVPDRQSQIPFGDTYIVKSENDQDRPNLLGREGSWVY